MQLSCFNAYSKSNLVLRSATLFLRTNLHVCSEIVIHLLHQKQRTKLSSKDFISPLLRYGIMGWTGANIKSTLCSYENLRSIGVRTKNCARSEPRQIFVLWLEAYFWICCTVSKPTRRAVCECQWSENFGLDIIREWNFFKLALTERGKLLKSETFCQMFSLM